MPWSSSGMPWAAATSRDRSSHAAIGHDLTTPLAITPWRETTVPWCSCQVRVKEMNDARILRVSVRDCRRYRNVDDGSNRRARATAVSSPACVGSHVSGTRTEASRPCTAAAARS